MKTKTTLLAVRSIGGPYRTVLACSIALGLVGTMLMLSPAPAMAKNSKNKKTRDQREIDRATRLIGENFDALNQCLDNLNDAKRCFEDVIITSGIAFAIASFIKTHIHDINPTNFPGWENLEALVQCLESGEDPQTCTQMLDPRIERLAVLFQSYRELRPYCGAPNVLCDRPVDWPSEWPWPFRETRGRSRH